MPAGTLTHTGSIIKLTLRLDRLWLPVWVIACITFAVCFVPMLPALVESDQMLETLKETMNNPAVVAMCGMMYGEEYTFGIMYSQMMILWSALVVAVMNIFLVNRHTRKDEEEGRLELLSSLPIGKAAPLASLAIIIVVANALIALIIAATMTMFGLDSIDFAGSLVYGAAIGGVGLVFGALTMLFAQLASTSKSTLGLSFALLCVMYLLRAIGDITPNAATNPLGFISPFGLAERSYPFYENLWWPIAVMALAAVILVVLAFVFKTRRNLGAGLLPARYGRAHGGRSLVGHITLCIRLVRGTLIAWAVVLFILGAAYGAVFDYLGAYYEKSAMVQGMLGQMGADGSLIDLAIGSLIVMISIVAVVPVMTIVNHLRLEERRKRLELVYATASSKTTALLGYTIVAAVCALLFQLLSAAGMWMGAAATMSDAPALGIFITTALNALPPILVFVGLTTLLIGLAPRLVSAVWLYLAYTFYMVYFGSMLKLPEIFVRLSPFGMIARYPTETFDPLPLCALLAVFAAISAVGIVAYRRRDIG